MKKFKAFTLVELLIVMSVVAILVSVIIPSFRGMQEESWITKAQHEVRTLQVAVESYYRHHNNTYPDSLADLLAADVSPRIVNHKLKDHWNTDGDGGYGYQNLADGYVIYSYGPKPSSAYTATNPDGKIEVKDEDDIVISNHPVIPYQGT